MRRPQPICVQGALNLVVRMRAKTARLQQKNWTGWEKKRVARGDRCAETVARRLGCAKTSIQIHKYHFQNFVLTKSAM